MRLFCLGGTGRICREAVLDLAACADVRRITIGDLDEAAGRILLGEIGDPRVDFVRVDVRDPGAAAAAMAGYDAVADGTPIRLNGLSTEAIARAGCSGINLNGFGEEAASGPLFLAKGRVHVAGFGMTPGVTNLMAKQAADRMDRVETVRVSHGAFRPVAFSPAITETTTYEYDPDLPGRVVFEEGRFVKVPPFSRERSIALPPPFGTHPQWIIPHPETRTLAAYLGAKGVGRIEVRGTWPPKNMQLIRTLYDWGFFRNDPVTVKGCTVGIMDAVGAYLQQSPEGRETELYGYALHVQVVGTREGKRVEHVLTHTHPPSDGSVPGWEGLRAYTRCVGIPLGVGARLIAAGRVSAAGVVSPEEAFDPGEVFAELEKRGIRIDERVREVSGPD